MAEARDDRGPVRGHRRGPRWTQVSHGLYLPTQAAGPRVSVRDARPADAEEQRRIQAVWRAQRLAHHAAWQLVLPGTGRFTHLTSADIYGWQTPPLPLDLPVCTAQALEESRPQREGLVVVRRSSIAPSVERERLRVDPPAETLLSCARHLGLLDLVVLVDSALHLRSCTLDDLRAVVSRRRPGVPRMREAVELADARAESAHETLLRVLHVACGIEVEPRYELRDCHGQLVARAALWLMGTHVMHEYDGADHLGRRRQRTDLRRAARVNNQDWIRRGYTAPELLHQGSMILREADLSVGRPHGAARIRRWNALLADSLFTPSGSRRFRDRIGLPAEAPMRAG